jgi:hypothetical protein
MCGDDRSRHPRPFIGALSFCETGERVICADSFTPTMPNNIDMNHILREVTCYLSVKA